MLRIAGFVRGSTVDGPGIRNVVFFQGCSHGCPNCHNPETHSFQGGEARTVNSVVDELVGGFSKGETPLVTISGGDPLYQPTGLEELCRALKVRHSANIWLYTGFSWEQLQVTRYSILKNVDVLVDGLYMEEKRTLDSPFVGSSNQRLINCTESYIRGKMVLWCTRQESRSDLVSKIEELAM